MENLGGEQNFWENEETRMLISSFISNNNLFVSNCVIPPPIEVDSRKPNSVLFAEVLSQLKSTLDPPVQRQVWSTVEKSNFWEVVVPQYSSKEFKDTFRVDKDTFQFLVDNLVKLRKQDTNWRSAIPLPKRVAICLYVLGSSTEMKKVASLFGVGRSTVTEMLIQFSRAVWETFQGDFICAYPVGGQMVEDNVKHFEDMGFPQVFAAIDCCHIEIQAPKKEAADYVNLNKSHSIVLFVAADYKSQFVYIDVGTPGSINESAIFEDSSLQQHHATDTIFRDLSKEIEGVSVPVLLLGDSPYPLSDIIMKPFPISLVPDPAEERFNENLLTCRRVVEDGLQNLKARFRRISKGLEMTIPNVISIVKACCVLYNICGVKNDKIIPDWLETMEEEGSTDEPTPIPTHQPPESPEGIVIREAIKNYLYGSVVPDDASKV